MQQRTTIHSETAIEAGISSVWTFLSNSSVLATLCRSELGVNIVFADKNNTAETARNVFVARASSYNILFTGAGCSYAVRLSEQGENCLLLIAASFDDTSFIMPSKIQLDNFLQRIKHEIPSKKTENKDTSVSPVPADTDPGARESTRKIYRAGEETDETVLGSIDIMISDTSDSAADEQNGETDSFEPLTFEKEQVRRHKKPRWPLLFVALAVLVAAVCAAYMFIPAFRAIFIEQVPEETGYSAKVSFKNAMKISPGDSKDSVGKLFGTDGVLASEQDETCRIYRGGALSENGLYTVQVCVDYFGPVVSKITYLDLGVAANLESPFDKYAEISADMTIEAIAGAVGVPVSMTRTYKSGGDDIVEVHFGFTDPFANFDPAWRGEFALTINKTAKTVDKQFWAGYDGSDPLMIESLDGHPASNQYSDYTEFLNDKYRYDHALYMLNKYSRGDAIRVFGDITLYNDISGADLYYHNSEETLPDGQPVYIFSFGFDSKGQFLMSSFSNMRLFPRQNMLSGSHYRDIMRGMAYNEVRYLMQVLPTSIWIDQNYFTLCYGQKLDSDIFENSFEFIVRIDIENNYVQTIWNNMPSNV